MSIANLPCGCMNMCMDRCTICKKHSVDSVEFEGGNNAEFSMIFNMCQEHWDDYEKDEWAFRDKYAELIDNACYEELIDAADALRDRAKYEGKPDAPSPAVAQ